MNNAVVYANPWDVSRRLADFELNRSVLLEVIEACVLGRNGCTENDPPGSRGYEAYRWGTRRARELLRGQGWEIDNFGGFATVVNHRKRFRMAFMNADDGAGTLDEVPMNRCRKGANSERVAAQNDYLFSPEELPIPAGSHMRAEDGYETWHLCVFIKGDPRDLTVRAELTLLSDFENGFFTRYAEKIILIKDGDWPREMRPDTNDGDEDDDQYDVKVVRR